MKTLTPTNLIAVEVPKDAIRIKKFDLKEHDDEETGFSLEWLIQGNSFYDAKLIPFDFEILGEVTDTEVSFDVEPYLKNDTVFINGMHRFRTYTDLPSGNTFDKNESFRSLLQSNGLYFKNPMGK